MEVPPAGVPEVPPAGAGITMVSIKFECDHGKFKAEFYTHKSYIRKYDEANNKWEMCNPLRWMPEAFALEMEL